MGQPVETLLISLPPLLAEYVREKVSSGEYTDPDDVVREALRALKRREAEFEPGGAPDFEAVELVRAGIEDIEQGRFRDLEAPGLQALGDEIIAAIEQTAASMHPERR